jgi:GTP-binding protein
MKEMQGSALRVVDAAFIAGAVDSEQLPPPTFTEVAFAGRSNVGKSSLLNAMMQRKGLARTSNTPGCTRQLNVFELRAADGLSLRFVDLPGYGWARRSKKERSEWQTMIEGYLTKRASLRAIVLLVDVRRGVEEEEQQLVEFLGEPRRVSAPRPLEVILVATKIDKLTASARKPALDKVREHAVAAGATGAGRAIGFSAVTGDGVEELWGRIRYAVLGAAAPPAGGAAPPAGGAAPAGGEGDAAPAGGEGNAAPAGGEGKHVELAGDSQPR